MLSLKNKVFIGILILLSTVIQAEDPPWSPESLKHMGAALAALLFMVMGLRWIAADSAQERGEAKKGMMYITIGVLIIASYDQLVCDLYCRNITCPGC